MKGNSYLQVEPHLTKLEKLVEVKYGKNWLPKHINFIYLFIEIDT